MQGQQLNYRCRRAQPLNRSRSAKRFSTETLPEALAPAVMVPTALVRPSALILRVVLGSGETEAFGASPMSSRTAYRSRSSILVLCHHLGESVCRMAI
jgi:hypothetical protein